MELNCDNNQTQDTKQSLMNYDAELAVSFQKDCEKLLKQFEQEPIHNFKAFGEVWKQMEFTGIFQDQQYLAMLEVYLENCYLIAKKFLFSTDKSIRYGAIYLLYSLFYKQPIKKWIKIRLTESDFLQIHVILNESDESITNELRFIYNKLCLDNAFVYCAKELPLRPDVQRFDLKQYPIVTDPHNLIVFDHYQQLRNDFNEFQQIDGRYQELLKKYQNNHGLETNDTIYQKLDEIDQIFDEDRIEQQQQQIGEVTLKRKALENQFAVYRGNKRVITRIDLDKRK